MMNDERKELIEAANTARTAARLLSEAIYKYIGKCITIDELQQTVDSMMSSELITQYTHQYILKDTYSSLFTSSFVLDDCDIEADDLEQLEIKEE